MIWVDIGMSRQGMPGMIDVREMFGMLCVELRGFFFCFSICGPFLPAFSSCFCQPHGPMLKSLMLAVLLVLATCAKTDVDTICSIPEGQSLGSNMITILDILVYKMKTHQLEICRTAQGVTVVPQWWVLTVIMFMFPSGSTVMDLWFAIRVWIIYP